MPTWEALVTFIIASLVLIAIPGPSVMFSVGRSLALGKKFGVLTVLGNAMGTFVWIVLVAVGLGAVIASSEIAYQVIRYGGAAYLIYLGIEAIRHRSVHAADMTNQGDIAPSIRRSIRDGFWVGALNPKAIVFYAAVLPQFIDRERGHITGQLILLGAIFSILAFISDGSWGLLAGTARQWLATDPRRLEKLRATGGCIMIILGISVLIAAIVSA
jgi:threonine/homoserine/homoserine lactone efflux protein